MFPIFHPFARRGLLAGLRPSRRDAGRGHGAFPVADAFRGQGAGVCRAGGRQRRACRSYVAAALGLSALLAASSQAYEAVKIAGALYLLLLAYSALRHGTALKLKAGNGKGGTADLLQTFEDARAAGEIDDAELERVREKLGFARKKITPKSTANDVDPTTP